MKNLTEAAAILAEFLKAGEKATPGPWTADGDGDGVEDTEGDLVAVTWLGEGRPKDAAFIALSRSVPDALMVVLKDIMDEILEANADLALFGMRDVTEIPGDIRIRLARCGRIISAITPLLERRDEEEDRG